MTCFCKADAAMYSSLAGSITWVHCPGSRTVSTVLFLFTMHISTRFCLQRSRPSVPAFRSLFYSYLRCSDVRVPSSAWPYRHRRVHFLFLFLWRERCSAFLYVQVLRYAFAGLQWAGNMADFLCDFCRTAFRLLFSSYSHNLYVGAPI